MEVYSPAEMAKLLGVKQPTLRKYSIMLEERGYKISRNSQNHRYYSDKDIITLRRIITGRESGVTLEESINNVVSIDQHNTYPNATNNTDTPNNNDIQELKELIHKQNEKIDLQNEVMKELVKQLEEQRSYIKNRDEQRDRDLTNAMNQMMEIKEAQKQIATAEAEEQEQKKTWWQKILQK